MDEVSGKRSVDELISTKRSGLALRETAGRNSQPCSKLGCGSRLNIIRGGQSGYQQKAKFVKSSSICSSGGGSSSRNNTSAVNNPRKETKKTDSSETSSELGVGEVTPPPGKMQKGVAVVSREIEVGSSNSSPPSPLSSASSSGSGSRNGSYRNSASGKNKRSSATDVSASVGPVGSRQLTSANGGQCSLRSLKCSSVSDAIPSSSRSLNKRKDTVKSRNFEGETSSSRGKKIDGSPLGQNPGNGITIPEYRRARNGAPDRMSLSTTRRPNRSSPGARRPSEGNTGNFSSSHATNPRASHITVDGISPSSLHELSSESILRRLGISSRSGSSNEVSQGMSDSSPEHMDMARSLLNWETFQRNSIEGMAEVLAAFERIERDEALDYEQLVALETSLFLGGFNAFDQHREMRMDIDNMSYEELLALEERMGTVSTALTEEALSTCLKRDLYQTGPGDDAGVSVEKDDTKCSICQEEYSFGDEVGRLHCEHLFHVECINQWLRLKNWCPICKGSAEISLPPPHP